MSKYSLPSAPLLLLVTDRTRYGDRSLEDVFVPGLAGGVCAAALAGCGPVFIYDLESAKTTLRLDKLLDVLDVLGLELVLRRGNARLRVDLRA